MVGMLVFLKARREYNSRPTLTDDGGDFDGVRHAHFQMRIAIQF